MLWNRCQRAFETLHARVILSQQQRSGLVTFITGNNAAAALREAIDAIKNTLGHFRFFQYEPHVGASFDPVISKIVLKTDRDETRVYRLFWKDNDHVRLASLRCVFQTLSSVVIQEYKPTQLDSSNDCALEVTCKTRSALESTVQKLVTNVVHDIIQQEKPKMIKLQFPFKVDLKLDLGQKYHMFHSPHPLPYD